jgi:hypothetical protein
METDNDPEVEIAWDEELQRRAIQIEKGEITGKPAEEVFARLREKYS